MPAIYNCLISLIWIFHAIISKTLSRCSAINLRWKKKKKGGKREDTNQHLQLFYDSKSLCHFWSSNLKVKTKICKLETTTKITLKKSPVYLKILIGLAIKLIFSYFFKRDFKFQPKMLKAIWNSFSRTVWRWTPVQPWSRATVGDHKMGRNYSEGEGGEGEGGEKSRRWGREEKRLTELSPGFLSAPQNIVYILPFLFGSLYGTKALCALQFSFKNLFPWS